MKKSLSVKKELLVGLMFLSLFVNAQSYPKIVGAGVWGPEEAKAGYVNINSETDIDLSALPNGMYVLYIQLGSNSIKTYKFLLNN